MSSISFNKGADLKNMKIVDWQFKIGDSDELELHITFMGNSWGVDATISFNNIKRFFETLGITNIKNLDKVYCRGEFRDNLLYVIYNIIDDDKFFVVRGA